MSGFWKKTGTFLVVVVFLALTMVIGLGVLGRTMVARWYWMMGLMVAFLMALGYLANQRLDGVLIDWRNKMSLSRLQLAAWTVLGMSAFLVLALGRVVMAENGTLVDLTPDNAQDFARMYGAATCLDGVDQVTDQHLQACPDAAPMEIVFPEELILAMGISVASFAGSSLVKRNNSAKNGSPYVGAEKEQELRKKIEDARLEEKTAAEALARSIQTKNDLFMKQKQAQDAGDQDGAALIQSQLDNQDLKIVENRKKSDEFRQKRLDLEKQLEQVVADADKFRGMVHTNASTADAAWSELFAEEGKAHDRIDLSKVQMFFITAAVILAYAGALNSLLKDPLAVSNPFGVALPVFSSSLVLLLGISHGGYLTIKSTAEPER